MEFIREVRIISTPEKPSEAQCEAINNVIEQFLNKQENELRAVLSELQRDFHTQITLAVLL